MQKLKHKLIFFSAVQILKYNSHDRKIKLFYLNLALINIQYFVIAQFSSYSLFLEVFLFFCYLEDEINSDLRGLAQVHFTL